MQIKTQRLLTTATFLSLLLSLTTQSCKKEKTYAVPSIEFKTEVEYQYNDTTLLLNDAIMIEISATTNSDVNLTNFIIEIDNDDHVTKIDSGINTELFTYKKTINKNTAIIEKWSFSVSDRDGRVSEKISLTLNLDAASIFGEIISVPSVIMGAQDNASIGGLYSLSENQVYTLPVEQNDESFIDLLYYYDTEGSDGNTIASPGAQNLENIIDLTSWTTKNTTRFEANDLITLSEFDNCTNDSLILNNTFEYATGKRKAKQLINGKIYSFITVSGTKGLFKVINVTDQETGTIEIAIKMQD